MKIKIKSPKDFWAGLMFIGFGVFFVMWAWIHYQMGSAVRMGPAYFPTLLGGLLTFLGALVLIEGFAVEADPKEGMLKVPFTIVDLGLALGVYVVMGYISKWTGIHSDYAILVGTLIVVVLTVLYRPDAKALVLISAGCVAYGYLMKPLGLVLSTAALVFISAYGGHEFKWKEVSILFVILIIFSVLVFVKGLTLPFPLWPAAFE